MSKHQQFPKSDLLTEATAQDASNWVTDFHGIFLFALKQSQRGFCGFFGSAEFALGDDTGAGAGRAGAAGLAIASRLTWPRALTSRVTFELSIPVSALAGARTGAFTTGRGVVGATAGRGVLVTVEGCFGATGAGTGRVSLGARIG
jgi:hypothetical protein